MEWQLEYGDKIKFFQELQAQGRATPLDEGVPITETAIWFIDVFHILTRERAIGMSNGPIPPSAMYEYADRFGLIGTLEEFIGVMCALDDIYLKHMSDERKRVNERNKSKPKR